MLNDFFNDCFHACALQAYYDVMLETNQFPPDSDLTKQRAYEYFERDKSEHS